MAIKYSRNATSRKCGVAFLSRRSRRIPAAVFLSSSFSLSLDNTDMTNSITIPSACDFHLHLRQDEMMRMVTPKVPEGGVSVAYIMVTFPSNTHNDTLWRSTHARKYNNSPTLYLPSRLLIKLWHTRRNLKLLLLKLHSTWHCIFLPSWLLKRFARLVRLVLQVK